MTDTTAAGAPEAPAAPAPGTPEYDQAMAEKFRESQEGTSPLEQSAAPTGGEKPTRPENVPEKFWDAETGQVRVDDLLKSYTELESKGGKPTPDPKDPAATEQAAQDAAKAAGLDWNDLGSKITAKGDIEASDYEALAKAGIPKEIVQEFIGLRQSAIEGAKNAAYQYGGGKEAVDKVLTWASQSMTPEQIAGYNQMLAGPSWQVAIDTLKALHAKANPSEPSLVVGKGGSGGAVAGYTSQDDMQVDMRKPLYREMSPAGEKFRAEVREKVRLATFRQ